MPRNPFTVLGLPLDATTESIKAAWRRLARENHPDVTSGDGGAERQANKAMAEINAAYHELRDPEKRRVHRVAAAREARARGSVSAAQAASEAAERADRAERDERADNGFDGHVDDLGVRRPGYGTSHPSRPVTARIDTSALLRPRNAVLHPTDRSPLPGLRPRPRNSEMREPPRASTPSGPTVVSAGPNLDSDLPNLATALDTPLRFGKFAGLTLGDVAELEPTYIDWIVRTIDRDPEVTMAARVVLRDLERSGTLMRRRYDTANPSG